MGLCTASVPGAQRSRLEWQHERDRWSSSSASKPSTESHSTQIRSLSETKINGRNLNLGWTHHDRNRPMFRGWFHAQFVTHSSSWTAWLKCSRNPLSPLCHNNGEFVNSARLADPPFDHTRGYVTQGSRLEGHGTTRDAPGRAAGEPNAWRPNGW